jgi:hypothetical protein
VRLLKLVDQVRFSLSVILVALAVILLTVAQWLDEEPVIYWMRKVVVELVKGLAETPAGGTQAQGPKPAPEVEKPVKVVHWKVLPLAGDDNE